MWTKIKKRLLKEEEKASDVDYLIVGLGNPGEKYKKTAHNIGFRVISHLKEEEEFPSFEKDNPLNSLIAKGKVDEKNVVLLFPLTFMNRSGEAVRKATARFLDNPETLIVVHDDTDLPLGTLKFSYKRGSAGHKGVLSILNHIKTKKFVRLRVGVRTKEGKALSTVLKNLPERTEDVEKQAAKILKEKITSGLKSETIKI